MPTHHHGQDGAHHQSQAHTHQGGGIETSYGSWDRKTAAAEFGGVSKDGSVDYFIAGNYFDEDGWRDYSPSKVKQIFTLVL